MSRLKASLTRTLSNLGGNNSSEHHSQSNEANDGGEMVYFPLLIYFSINIYIYKDITLLINLRISSANYCNVTVNIINTNDRKETPQISLMNITNIYFRLKYIFIKTTKHIGHSL